LPFDHSIVHRVLTRRRSRYH